MKNALGSNQYKNKYHRGFFGSIGHYFFGTTSGSILVLYLIALIAVIGMWLYQDANARLKVAFASESIVSEVNQNQTRTNHENEALKDKLNGIFSTTQSDTTKKIVDYYLIKYFGKDADTARKIFTCESGLNPNAINTKNRNGSVDGGVPQINSIHAQRFENMYGIPLSIGVHDIDLSIQYAKHLYDTSGWYPWSCAKITGVTQ